MCVKRSISDIAMKLGTFLNTYVVVLYDLFKTYFIGKDK